MFRNFWIVCVLFVALIANVSCGGAGNGIPSVFAYALLNPGEMRTVNLLTGSPFGGTITLSALIRNIAIRPTDGLLFGIGSDLRLYQINPTSGACVAVNATPLAIDGHNGGMTFAPGSTTIRFVSVNGANYRISSTAGTVTNTDTTANVAAIGLAVRTSDNRYFAYASNDTVVSTLDPDSGVYTSVGPSGVDSSGSAGLSIDNDFGIGYFVANEGIFSMNLSTGALTLINGSPYNDIAVVF